MTKREEIEIEWLAQKEKWGLSDWELRFSRQKRHLGYCRPRRRIISVSLSYMETNPFPVMKDTLLHEIAHALHYLETGKTGHDNGWKEAARRVGCAARRCASGNGLTMPQGKYVGVCPSCDKTVHFYRKVRRSYSCSECSRGYDPRYKLQITKNGT